MYNDYDILVIGAGISGTVIAERYANQGKKVLVLEKREHLGGNCFDYLNQDGICISKYGAHLFHTNSQKVWDYLQSFADWRPYEHKVVAKVDNKIISLPVNIHTINKLYDINLKNADEMKLWLDERIVPNNNPQSSKEWGLLKVGKELYEKLFKNYSQKQWGLDLKELDSSILSRLPVRYNFDDRYFSDKYQALPENGFTSVFEKLLDSPNIKLLLNTDFFEIQKDLPNFEKVFYTGPVDKYFEYKYGRLEYRSLDIKFERHHQKKYQENSVVNYPGLEYPFTRIIEYKYFYPVDTDWTVISKEYPTWEGEPYYPVPRARNKEIYQKYAKEAKKLEEKGIYFLGRLARYKYINMDQAFAEALNLYQKLSS